MTNKMKNKNENEYDKKIKKLTEESEKAFKRLRKLVDEYKKFLGF